MAIPVRKPREINTPWEHYEFLHRPQVGTAVLWERESLGRRWHKLQPDDPHIPALLRAQAGTRDGFVTVNEFRWWRQVDNLKALRALYVDIDRPMSMNDIDDALSDARLPRPSLVVWSGRGVHCYWLHASVPAQALPVWQRCQDLIVKTLQPVGADPAAKDCARVLRLVGTRNAKNGELVRGWVLDPAPWPWHELCDAVLGPRVQTKLPDFGSQPKLVDLATAKASRGQRIRTGSIYDWWHCVYKDLLAITDHHWFGGIPEGHRDTFLFISAVALSWFAHADTLQGELERRAQTWTPGLRASEVREAISSPIERAQKAAAGLHIEWQGEQRDPRYWFKRETLYERLAPLIDADLAPKLRAIVNDDVHREHKRETRRAHEAKRDRVAEGRYTTRQADSTERAEPWIALGISRRTYYRRKAADPSFPDPSTPTPGEAS